MTSWKVCSIEGTRRIVAIASLYLHPAATIQSTLHGARDGSRGSSGPRREWEWGDSQALATTAHGLGADEEELALGDLHDLGRVGIVCDAGR